MAVLFCVVNSKVMKTPSESLMVLYLLLLWMLKRDVEFFRSSGYNPIWNGAI